jgi:hypothetical protein
MIILLQRLHIAAFAGRTIGGGAFFPARAFFSI